MMGTIYIACASILWGVVHSILASHGFKRLVRRSFGRAAFDRFYRVSYNLFALASLYPIVLMLVVAKDQPLYMIPSPWVYLTTIVQGLAVFALIAGIMQTGPMEFAGLAQLSPYYEDSQPSQLVTHGLYSYIRHPLYSACLIFIWFSPEMSINKLVLWVTFSLYFMIGAWFEERKLLKDFGPAYADYKMKTPMFVPGLRKKV